MVNPTNRSAVSRELFLATLAETLTNLPRVERAALHAAVLAARRHLELTGGFDTALDVVSLALDRVAGEDNTDVH